MLAIYSAIYCDHIGEERTAIENDGKTLRMVVRGVEFSGAMFDDFEPSNPNDPAVSSFTLAYGMLTDCIIEYDMPVPVVSGGESLPGLLHVRLPLGNVSGLEFGGSPNVLLTLSAAGQTFSSSGKHGWFEDELRDIQAALPEGMYVKCCFTCAFSDYSPVGNGIFGCMACFRSNKEAYRAVKGKAGLFAVWDTLSGFVQETYLCPEYERRKAGSGYRG